MKPISILSSILIAVGLNLGMVMPSLAQETVLRSLTVTGQGEQVIPTTIAQVHLGVEIQGKTAQEVQEEVAKRSTAVVNLLRSQPVTQLQTTGIRLQPQYSYNDNQKRLIGYVGTNTVSFKIETEKTGELIDRSVEAGATRIDGIQFTATDEAIALAEKEALQEAALDAQEQAQAVLAVLNLTQQEIIGISVNHATPPPPMIQRAESFTVTSEASSPVIGGEQTIRSSVTLQIRY